jgi:putative MATE family efflux protein
VIGKILVKGTPWKLILSFAMPIMAGNLLQQLYNTADTIIVGNFVGEAALSAVGTCSSMTMLYLALAQGFSMGAGILAAQLFGAGKTEEMRRLAGTSILLLTGMGLLASFIGAATAGLFLRYFLGVPDSLLNMAVIYFIIYAAGLIFQFAYNIVAALLRAVGDSKASLYFLLVSSTVNIVLDLLFVAVFHWGVAGAAIATVLSQLCCCVAAYGYMQKRYPVFRFRWRDYRFDREIGAGVLRTGAPMALQQGMVSCGFFLIQRTVNSYGPAMTASFTVAQRIEGYVLIPPIALQNTMATYCGQNFGEGRTDRLVLGLKQAVMLSVGMILCLSILLFLFPAFVIGFFGIEGVSLGYCIQHVRSMAFAYLIFAAYFPSMGLFQAVGKGFWATYVSSAALGGRVLFTYTLCRLPVINYSGLWWSQPLGWCIAGVMTCIMLFCMFHSSLPCRIPGVAVNERKSV